MALIHSITHLQDKVKASISMGNIDAALRLIHQLVIQVVSEPINTAQIFGSKLLDDLCQEIGALNLQRLRTSEPELFNIHKQSSQLENTVVYIASKLQASGGHTAVLADIIRLSPSKNTVILLTGVGGKTDCAAIQHRFSGIHNISFEYAPKADFFSRLTWLQKKIAVLQPSDVWLFNHHQDSIAIAAAQPKNGYQLHFYHHGDHHLCLGVYLDYANHVDIHPMGYHYCRDALHIENNHYLPMVVKDLGGRPKELPFVTNGLVTCTAAGFNKIEVPYFIQYVEIIPKMLLASSGRHIHIGKLTPFALYKIRRNLRKLGLPETSFVYVPFVPSVWKALHEYKVDLYVTSFPYGGARTLIEVMGAGVPIAMHSHCTSRLLGTFDMAYQEVFLWRTPQELFNVVKSIGVAQLQSHSLLARHHYEIFHQEQVLINALSLNAQYVQSPPLLQGYEQNVLQNAIDISTQVSFLGVLKRLLYRTYRQWKSSRA